MNIRVLGCAGAELPTFRPTALLVDEDLLLDAGTIGAVLDPGEQLGLKAILITHAHHDHIRAIPALAENLAIEKASNSLALVGSKAILDTLRKHVFNNVIWPDFAGMPSDNPVLKYIEITPGTVMELHGYSVEAVPVNHTVPAIGYLLRKGSSSLLYAGDTGPTEKIWGAAKDITSLVVEVSFPNRLEHMALETGHLTACLMRRELQKMEKVPSLVYVTHLKPQYHAEIRAELEELNIENITVLEDGGKYTL